LLHEIRIALAEGLLLAQLECTVLALGEPEQASLERFGHLADADLKGGRPIAEGANDVGAGVGETDAVMQRQVRAGLHHRRLHGCDGTHRSILEERAWRLPIGPPSTGRASACSPAARHS